MRIKTLKTFIKSSWYKGLVLIVILLYKDSACIEAISASKFNANIREFADNAEKKITNSSVRTLQKQERVGEVSFGLRNLNKNSDQLRFKPPSDNDASSSNYGRGFNFFPHNELSYGYTGYEGVGYEDKHPMIEHYYQEPHHQHEPHQHYEPHYIPEHDFQHHHHHGYDKHALAVKTLLLPLAGIALLGAAATLVTNPILLQLGVVSGRRRKRAISDDYLQFDEDFVTFLEKYNTNVDRTKFNKGIENEGNNLKTGEVESLKAGKYSSTKNTLRSERAGSFKSNNKKDNVISPTNDAISLGYKRGKFLNQRVNIVLPKDALLKEERIDQKNKKIKGTTTQLPHQTSVQSTKPTNTAHYGYNIGATTPKYYVPTLQRTISKGFEESSERSDMYKYI